MGRSLAYLAHFAGAWLLPSAFWKSLISLKAHSSLNNQSIQRLLCTERAKIGITWNKHRAYCNTNRLRNLGTRLYRRYEMLWLCVSICSDYSRRLKSKPISWMCSISLAQPQSLQRPWRASPNGMNAKPKKSKNKLRLWPLTVVAPIANEWRLLVRGHSSGSWTCKRL